jgi:hypothetical protein
MVTTGRTGLFWAIRGGHIQATTEFLSRGAKVASYDRDEIPRGAREVALLDKEAPLSNHEAQGTALPTASQSAGDVGLPQELWKLGTPHGLAVRRGCGLPQKRARN